MSLVNYFVGLRCVNPTYTTGIKRNNVKKGYGMKPKEIIDDFPELTEDDIYASLSYAADKERKIAVI